LAVEESDLDVEEPDLDVERPRDADRSKGGFEEREPTSLKAR
jgi:hypothetical protein